MHPLAFQKLWKSSGGKLPFMDRQGYEMLIEAAEEFHDPDGLQYWGIVGQQVRYRGHQLLHCYNFGNTTIEYPWRARLVNFGHDLPAMIRRGGTVKIRERGRNMLDRLVDPYLVFGFESDSALSEHLQPGMLVTEGRAAQCSEFDIAVPEGMSVPPERGIMFYYLMKRIQFQAEPADKWIPPGAVSGLSCFRMKLREPVVMEPGWLILMLEKNRWFWGVVCR